MTHEETANAGMNRCSNLRWKGMFVSAQWDEAIPHGGDNLFWCLKTQTCLGPDGQLAESEQCNASRSCFRLL
ncbi:MAG: hypothetical protein IT160_14725 [Bryobacterales bacterium]|nr:hypothetical protein [Bryobacterales bacterium]